MAEDPERYDPALAQTAAEWVARRDRGFSAREAVDFAAWEKADPRHALALRQVAAAWRGLDRIGGVVELEAMADQVVRTARARQLRRRRWHVTLGALGAAAAIAVGSAGWQRFKPAPAVEKALPDNIRVLASTLQSRTLPDGSVAELNGRSRIEVEFSATERRVRLTEGEAHFIVTKDPARPFYVTAGPVSVRAVGTAFNVRLEAGAIEVLVTEGKVQMEASATAPVVPAVVAVPPPALVAGQRVLIDRVAGMTAAVAVGEVAQSEIDEALGWQGTRLVFSATTLDEVVAAFNRYNRHRLALGDPKLSSRTLTGTFRADNLEGFLRLVRQMVDVKVELRTPTETVLLPAR